MSIGSVDVSIGSVEVSIGSVDDQLCSWSAQLITAQRLADKEDERQALQTADVETAAYNVGRLHKS